jgi:4-hydroxybenzoate polyprenyltransferase
MRLRQWSKNLLIFAAIIFSKKLTDPNALIISFIAFLSFSLISSGGYVINDIKDRKYDSLHPLKKERPIAAGKLTIPVCFIIIALLYSSGISYALLFLPKAFLYVILGYIALQLSYSFIWKHIFILDVLGIASGFFLRVLAGSVAIDVVLSEWLILCTILLAIFLALGKRRHELVLLSDYAPDHRKILATYRSPIVIDEMISAITGAIIVVYALYTVSKPQSPYLPITIPFVIYGIFRYLYLIHTKAKGGSPELDIFQDIPFFLNSLLWLISVILIIYTE